MQTDRVQQILGDLVGFPTITRGPNRALIDYCAQLLEAAGFAVQIVPAASGDRFGLLARFGAGAGGLLFSAHTDVVPVEGQDWTLPPFELTQRDGRLHGRGTTDMKGFIACVLAMAEGLRAAPPAQPVGIALSWDEEVGCRGIPEMIDQVIPVLGRPDLCIVGEPTLLKLAIGHKGKASYRAFSAGEAGHSAMAPDFTNALHAAADLIAEIRRVQADLMAHGAQDPDQHPACSTIHAGVMKGGVALNIVPDSAEVLFEIRHLATETPAQILAQLRVPEGVTITGTGSYPGLEADPEDPAVRAFAALLPDGGAEPVKIAFGTEAGFFAALGIPTVVCGPGTMRDGHQPDEGIEIAQLVACRALLERAVRQAVPASGR
ncbi:acetylornithine deacetylase [Pseudooceanicola sp. CBS1P-1]|uniref:Acetylornithine deacetylase n=1 Tax=Pseudooceanicola albus TaxID=2692189 RepID=A0A6L7G7X9_9RHOB|nr:MULTISPECIES: acetylornithine deacetylase [Pseudooceanicola]MBT9385348.1 acetylornithine deacetylase [Pseudooceanicola endophyticus]MXN18793.1 acetylornithine deacetylase [Pseudooceanicola albus]